MRFILVLAVSDFFHIIDYESKSAILRGRTLSVHFFYDKQYTTAETTARFFVETLRSGADAMNFFSSKLRAEADIDISGLREALQGKVLFPAAACRRPVPGGLSAATFITAAPPKVITLYMTRERREWKIINIVEE